jgi:hypothetical protein
MKKIFSTNQQESKLQKKIQYQTAHNYETINQKYKDIRVKNQTEQDFRKLAHSGIPAWKILETILHVINSHPEIREEIFKEEK